jgi:hypothetical protein
MLFLRAQVRMLGGSALEAILQLARRNDRKADDTLAVRGKPPADRWRIGVQQINPHRGVEQVHGAQSVGVSKSLSRSTRGAWCWRRSSTKSRGNSSRAANKSRPVIRCFRDKYDRIAEALHIDATIRDTILLREPHSLATSGHKHLCLCDSVPRSCVLRLTAAFFDRSSQGSGIQFPASFQLGPCSR